MYMGSDGLRSGGVLYFAWKLLIFQGAFRNQQPPESLILAGDGQSVFARVLGHIKRVVCSHDEVA